MCYAVLFFAIDANVQQTNSHLSCAFASNIKFHFFTKRNKRAIRTFIGGQIVGEGRGRPWAGRRRPPFTPTRIDVFANWQLAQKATWREAFGFMEPEQVQQLAHRLELIQFGVQCTSPRNMCLLFLHRMRTGCRYLDSGIMWGLSKSQARKIFQIVLKQWVSEFRALVCWPTREEETTSRRILEEVIFILFLSDSET